MTFIHFNPSITHSALHSLTPFSTSLSTPSFSPSLQGMIALRRGATELNHEDYMEGILEVQAKKKANLQYYA